MESPKPVEQLLVVLGLILQKSIPAISHEEKTELVTLLREQGLLWKQVAAKIGYSKSYTQQLYADPDYSKRDARRKTYGRICVGCGRITDGSQGKDKAPLRCKECTKRNFTEDLTYRISRSTRHKKWSDEECLNALRRVVAHQGEGVSINRYNALRQQNDPEGQTIMKRWSTWWGACEAAGVPKAQERRRTYEKSFTEEDCYRAFDEVADVYGRPPTLAEYQKYKKQKPALPSVSTIRKHCGTWAELIKEWMTQHEAIGTGC